MLSSFKGLNFCSSLQSSKILPERSFFKFDDENCEGKNRSSKKSATNLVLIFISKWASRIWDSGEVLIHSGVAHDKIGLCNSCTVDKITTLNAGSDPGLAPCLKFATYASLLSLTAAPFHEKLHTCKHSPLINKQINDHI
jgi:hypothetical protein